MVTNRITLYCDLGHILKTHGLAKRFSRRQLWDRLGEAGQPNIIYQYETGKTRPSVWWLLRWCVVMGIELPSLLASIEQPQGDLQVNAASK